MGDKKKEQPSFLAFMFAFGAGVIATSFVSSWFNSFTILYLGGIIVGIAVGLELMKGAFKK